MLVYDSAGNVATSNVSEYCSLKETSFCYQHEQYQVYTCTPTGRQYAVLNICGYQCPGTNNYTQLQSYCSTFGDSGSAEYQKCWNACDK